MNFAKDVYGEKLSLEEAKIKQNEMLKEMEELEKRINAKQFLNLAKTKKKTCS